MENLKYTVIDHPLVQHKLSLMRDVNTGSKEFRELVSETSMLMCYEAMRDLPLKEVDIQTPLGIAKSMSLIPAAKIGHIGTFRDPETTNTVEYYCKLPKDIASRDVIIADIMLATGGAASEAISLVKKAGAKNVKFMCLIANEKGIAAVNKAHPDVQIYCAAVAPELNDQLYIVPGLGDAGDRMYGTK